MTIVAMPKLHTGRIFQYDPRDYPFAYIVARIMAATDLDQIHRQLDEVPEVFKRENDQSTIFHKKFYQQFASYISPTYVELVEQVIRPHYTEPIAYQRIPTFRVHLPSNVAVGEFHRDRDYMHSAAETNYWLPMTSCWGTNTLWIESRPDAGDYRPIRLAYGQILEFDGANLRHGNKINETDHTRVSMDFRVVPMSKYQETDRLTINTKMRFAIGDYFSLCP